MMIFCIWNGFKYIHHRLVFRMTFVNIPNGRGWLRIHKLFLPLLHKSVSALLCLSAVCWTSCWHYFSLFHKGVQTAACLCSLYTKCTAERDPFWASGFLKQAICNCSTLYMAWGQRTDTHKVDSYIVWTSTKNSFILLSCCGQDYFSP